MTTRITLSLAVIALSAPACGGDGSSAGGPPPPRACTQIGCESGVVVSLASLPAATAGVRVCAAGRCRDITADRARAFVRLPAIGRQRHATVVVKLFNRSGDVIVSARRRVRMRRLQPNGPGCGPVCYFGRLGFRGTTGTLREERPSRR